MKKNISQLHSSAKYVIVKESREGVIEDFPHPNRNRSVQSICLSANREKLLYTDLSRRDTSDDH